MHLAGLAESIRQARRGATGVVALFSDIGGKIRSRAPLSLEPSVEPRERGRSYLSTRVPKPLTCSSITLRSPTMTMVARSSTTCFFAISETCSGVTAYTCFT